MDAHAPSGMDAYVRLTHQFNHEFILRFGPHAFLERSFARDLSTRVIAIRTPVRATAVARRRRGVQDGTER